MTAGGVKRALAAAEQAAFLWSCRGTLTRSSAVNLELLARFDGRLSQLLRTLRGDERISEQLLAHQPRTFNDGFAFVTGVAAALNGASHVVDALTSRADADPALLPALASALAWPGYTSVRSTVERMLGAESAKPAELGLWVAVSHGIRPEAAIKHALAADVPELRACGLATIGLLGLEDMRPGLLRALDDEHPSCRFWAGWGAVRMGDGAGVRVLGAFAVDGGPFALRACEIVLRALDASRASAALQRIHANAGPDLAVIAAGILGDPRWADWLFECMISKSLARRAAAAFGLMTGCDLRREDLDSRTSSREPLNSTFPTEGHSAQTEEPAAEASGVDYAGEPDEDLPWPDVVRLQEWWKRHRHHFRPGERYVAGVAVRDPALADVLRSGNQSQRSAAAFEFALIDSHTSLFDVTAPAHHQLARLARTHQA